MIKLHQVTSDLEASRINFNEATDPNLIDFCIYEQRANESLRRYQICQERVKVGLPVGVREKTW